METFDRIHGIFLMVVGCGFLWYGRTDLATFMTALAGVHFARIAAFK
ncbi:hypothetical protein [Brucella rhizosphaerae]|nr:hypothetical protein [Brucella rhizosphaerae]